MPTREVSPNSQVFLGQSLCRLLAFFLAIKGHKNCRSGQQARAFVPEDQSRPHSLTEWVPLEEAACCEAQERNVSPGLSAFLEEKWTSLRSQTSPACRHRPPAICLRLSLACLLGAKNSENGPQGPVGPAQLSHLSPQRKQFQKHKTPVVVCTAPPPTMLQNTITAGM